MTISIGPVHAVNPVVLAPCRASRTCRSAASRAGWARASSYPRWSSATNCWCAPARACGASSTTQNEAPVVNPTRRQRGRQMAEGARMAVDHGAAIIDINMGCPAKKVCDGLAGSALMTNLQKALYQIIEKTVKASRVPVTLKMRSGWDEASRNAPELARAAEAPACRW